MNKDKYNLDERPIHQQVNEFAGDMCRYRTEVGALGMLIDIDELNTEEGIMPEMDKYFINDGLIYRQHPNGEKHYVGGAPSQVEEIAPTLILSRAIEQVEQMGNYKVMVALVDLDNTKPKEERLYTFCDIESKKLRGVIYKEMEKEFE